MVQPVNYVIGGSSTQNPLSGFERGLQKAEGIQQLREKKIAREKKRSFETELADIAEDPSSEKLAALSLRYPEFAEKLTQPYKMLDAQQQKNQMVEAVRVFSALRSGKTDIAKRILGEQAAAYDNSDDETNAKATRDFMELVEISPETALTSAGLFLASAMGPENFVNNFRGLEVDRRLEKQFPTLLKTKKAELAKATSEAERSRIAAKFDVKLNKIRLNKAKREVETLEKSPVQRSEILDNGAIAMVLKNGDTRVVDQEDNELFGDDRVKALEEAGMYSARQAGVEAAEKKANELSQVQAQKGFEALGKIQQNITNLDSALVALERGAKTGYFADKLPSLRASTIELKNLQSQLGLDVIGSVTFGALSEGEMNLAMDLALPMKMDEKNLGRWLRQKKAAQDKMVSYLTDQVEFLATPGNTLGDWMSRLREEQREDQQIATQQPQQPSGSPIEVMTPEGPYYFSNQEQAAQFKAMAGL